MITVVIFQYCFSVSLILRVCVLLWNKESIKVHDITYFNDKIRQKIIDEMMLRKVIDNSTYNKTTSIYRFKLENVERIDPIEIKGQLGFWNYNK